MRETCRDAFARGEADRAACPLRMGDYKLRESRFSLAVMLETLEQVKAYQLSSPSEYERSLGCCTSYDAATWIEGLPAGIARELGYNILPAIAALAADGVPDSVVQMEAGFSYQDALIQVDNCDAVGRVLHAGGINLEIERLLRHRSLVVPLIHRAMGMIDDALALVPPPTPRIPHKGCP